MAKKYWLMKSEPDVFSLNDLKNKKGKTESWDGVRNYQARNFMRDDMKKGDMVLFYHSNCKPPGIAGTAVIEKESHPDHTQWDKKSKYYDPKATKDEPRWFMIALKYKSTFKKFVALDDLKVEKKLKEMRVIQKGSRLSITPVTKQEFEHILKMGS